MIYAQFWHAGLSGKLIPACGSDSVLPMDGRLNMGSIHARARARLAEPFFARKFAAFTIHRGESYSRSRPVSAAAFDSDGRAIPASDISPAYLVGDRIAPHS